MIENVAPADELAELRQRIKELQEQEAELRAAIISDPEARVGKAWRATIVGQASRRIDADKLRAEYPEVAAAVTNTVALTVVRVARLKP